MSSFLLIDEPPLQVLPTLAKSIGLNEAIVLQQVHYWLNPRFNKNFFEGRYWVRNTYKQWGQQFPFFSGRTLRRTIGNLETLGLLVSCMGGHLKQIKFYTINYDLLNQTDLASPDRVLQARPQKRHEEGKACQNVHGSLEGSEIDSSGQNVHPLSNWPDGEIGDFEKNPLKLTKNQSTNPKRPNWAPHLARLSTPPVQIGHPLWPDCPVPLDRLSTPSGQNGHLSYSKNTFREYTENTLLPPLPQISFQKNEEGEEEEEKNKFRLKFKNAVPGDEDQRSADGNQETEAGGQEEILGNQQSTAEAQQLAVGSREADQQPAISETPSTLVAHSGNRQACDPMALAMIAIWNEVVQAKLNPGQGVYLTYKRQALLEQFLHTVLADKAGQEKLDAWRDYCTRIASTRFLAGENTSGFKVSLDWALIPEKAYKVLEGVIYDKPLPKPVLDDQSQPWEELEQEIRQNTQENSYAEDWLKICQNLAKVLGQAMFKTWFAKASLSDLKGDTAILQVDTLFKRDYIDTHFRFDIVRAIQAYHLAVTQLKIQIVSRSDGNVQTTNRKRGLYHD